MIRPASFGSRYENHQRKSKTPRENPSCSSVIRAVALAADYDYHLVYKLVEKFNATERMTRIIHQKTPEKWEIRLNAFVQFPAFARTRSIRNTIPCLVCGKGYQPSRLSSLATSRASIS